MKKAVVIFSGGQDSTTCLYWALNKFDKVYAITFNYGQRHSIEVNQAQIICNKESVNQLIVDVSFMNRIADSALLNDGDLNEKKDGLPASFVPNRNLLFVTLAHAYAQKLGAKDIVMGVCETDYSGYPDCRQQFINQAAAAANIGSNAVISIHTPLMYLNKAQTFDMANRLGKLTEVVLLSHTCYKGNRFKLNNWGYGCGECPACVLRKKGWEEFATTLR